MSLENLVILFEVLRKDHFVGRLQALFNPSQLSYSKSVDWQHNAPAPSAKNGSGRSIQYIKEAPETLTLDLFFDTYGTASPLGVRPHTEAVAALARVNVELHRPPVCLLFWGKIPLFRGVLQQVSRTYLLFLEDGTPVRATMQCSFMELALGVELHSPDVAKTYTVRPGDTLMGIAAAMYGDISLWRRIAEANRIEDPRRLSPGQALSIPRIR